MKSEAFPLPLCWLQDWWEKSKMLVMVECHKSVMNIHWYFYTNLHKLWSHTLRIHFSLVLSPWGFTGSSMQDWSQHVIGMSTCRNQTLYSYVEKKKGRRKTKKKLWDVFRALFNSNWWENLALGVAVDFIMGLEAEMPRTKRAIATKTK